MDEDCLKSMTDFLTMSERLRLKCTDSYYNLTLEKDKYWMDVIPIPRPSWMGSNFIFVQKLLRKRSLCCMRCNSRLERFCILILCGCTGGTYPRWHSVCALPTVRNRNNRSLGIVSCPLCNKKSMYVVVTSFP